MPFSAEQFFEIFEQYNEFVFPLQAVLILAAAACVLLAFAKNGVSDRLISGILAFLWLWAGIVYHLTFFTQINPGAYIFGALFIFQAALFFYHGVGKKLLRFRLKNNLFGHLGMIFIFYALVVYPIAGSLLGRGFPFSPTFGAPCPVVIFTFGLLMLTDRRFPVSLLMIPFVWAGVGSFAAIGLGVREDLGLLFSALTAAFFLIRRYFAPKKEIWI